MLRIGVAEIDESVEQVKGILYSVFGLVRIDHVLEGESGAKQSIDINQITLVTSLSDRKQFHGCQIPKASQRAGA